MNVKNATIAIDGFVQSIFAIVDIINTPTQINTAAVAQFGINCAIGDKNIAIKKQTAVAQNAGCVYNKRTGTAGIHSLEYAV